MQRAAKVLPAVELRLQEVYKTASLGNKEDPLDELIYIQLSIRTREGAYAGIYDALYQQLGGDWEELLRRPAAQIIEVLRRGGMAEVKLMRLRAQIEQIRKTFGRITLDPLWTMDDHEAEELLTSLPGVGPKAARCVLMYSLGRSVFPVDSHCLRVLGRLGFAPPELDRKAAHDFLQELVPLSIRHALHVNLVHHGRLTCTPTNPRCERCPILSLCPTGVNRVELPQ
jgi:endonuclease III